MTLKRILNKLYIFNILVCVITVNSEDSVGKGKKGKVVPLRSIEAHLGERRYSSYSFLTSALEGGEWSASRPGRSLPPGKEPSVPRFNYSVLGSDF
jgi:hypothetical protein